MRYYLVTVGPVALPVCGKHVHEVLANIRRVTPELRHAPEPGSCKICEESE